MSGAAVLCGRAALRSGAGLVSVAVPEVVLDAVAGQEPCFTTVPLACDDSNQLSAISNDELQGVLAGRSVVAAGPGLGTSSGAVSLIRGILSLAQCPVVLDADALNICSDNSLLRSERPSPACVVTPHPGEFSRLTGRSVPEVEANREQLAREFAAENGVVVVLKGHRTVVTDGERAYLNQTGNSGMATGGSGDVLTGVLSALAAQGMTAFEAAALAVYVHGLAGDFAAAELSQRGLIASDLPDFLTKVWLRLEEEVAES